MRKMTKMEKIITICNVVHLATLIIGILWMIFCPEDIMYKSCGIICLIFIGQFAIIKGLQFINEGYSNE
jgi:hypothetical protein